MQIHLNPGSKHTLGVVISRGQLWQCSLPSAPAVSSEQNIGKELRMALLLRTEMWLCYFASKFKDQTSQKGTYSVNCPANTSCGAVPVKVPVPPMLAE